MRRSYSESKHEARQKAIEWQNNFGNRDHSYVELVATENYFTKLAKRYGLIREFRENAII